MSTTSRILRAQPGSMRPSPPARRRAPGRAVALALVLALLAGVPLGCADESEQFDRFMQNGANYAEKEQWDAAIIEYRNALQLRPNDPQAHHALAKAFLKNGKIREAYWEFHETARLDPSNVEARLAYGEFSLAAREFDEALAQADAVLEIRPDDPVALALRGRALEELGRAEEAEEPYRRALEVAEDKQPYTLVLAGYYQRRGQMLQAEALLREMVESDPGFETWTALGRLLAADRSRAADAEAAFRSALDTASPDEQKNAYRNLAGLYFNLGREAEAVALLEEGIERVDDKLDLIYLLARFHRSQGNRERADELVEEATRAEPDNPATYLVLSAYRGSLGDSEGALAAAEKALEVDPGNKTAKLRKAELLVDLGYRNQDDLKIAEGRSIVDAVLVKEPSDPAALFVRGKLQLAQGDYEGAKGSLREAIDGRPEWAQAHFVLGSAMLMTGDAPGARAELARAVELDPALLEARRLLAQVHAQLGEYEYAIEQGRVYLREHPDHVPTRIVVAQSLVRLGRGDEALADLQNLPEEQRTAEVYYALGRLRAAKGEYKAARELLLKADAATPNHPEVLRTLLGIDSRLGHVQEAADRVKRAVEAQPDSAALRVLNGMAAMLTGDAKGAEAEYKRAIQLAPDDLGAYQQLAFLYQRTGDVERMIATYEDAAKAQPDNARIQHLLGVMYELSGRTDEAVAAYEKAIALDADLGEPRNNLAYLFAEQGRDLDRALDLAQEAKALLPDSPDTADTLGWVLFKRGVPSAAVGYLQEAEANMDPSDSGIGIVRHHLALAYEASGQPEKAVETLQRAVDAVDRQMAEVRAAGREPRPPAWLPEVRAMLERLQSGAS